MMGRSMLAYIPVNLANIIVSFGTIAILTRLFTGAEFGRYALAVASMHFIHMGLFSWMEAAMARFYARAERQGELASHLKTAYSASLIMAATALPVFLGLLYISPLAGPMKTVLMFALSSTCITLIYNLGVESHKAAHRITRYSAIHASQSLIGFSVGILLILVTPLREQAPFVGIICANIIALAIDLPFMRRKMKGGAVSKARNAEYFKYGLPICLSLMLGYLLSQGDLFFIAYFMGETSVGQYNAGYNLANRSLDVIFVWMGMAVTPIAITALEHDGLEAAKSVLRRYGATLVLIILPAATGIALVAEPAGFILGESVRAEAIKIMPWIAFAGVLIMLRPNVASFGWAALLPLVAAFAMAGVMILNRLVSNQRSVIAAQFYGAFWTTVFMAIIAITGHFLFPAMEIAGAFSMKMLVLCATVAVLNTGCHFLLYVATMRASAATIAPIVYVQLVVSSLLSVYIFGDTMDPLAMAGGALIILGGLIMWQSERKIAAVVRA